MVELDELVIRNYIKNQEQEEKRQEQMRLEGVALPGAFIISPALRVVLIESPSLPLYGRVIKLYAEKNSREYAAFRDVWVSNFIAQLHEVEQNNIAHSIKPEQQLYCSATFSL